MDRQTKIWMKIDWITILIYVLLVVAGWLNIYSATYSEEHQSIFDLEQRYGKQLIWIICAFVIALFVMLIDSKFFVTFAYPIYGIFVVLLISVLLFGKEINGSKSWFVLGNFAIQPAEFAKFSTALAVSKMISSFNFKFSERNKVLRLIGLVLVPVVLILLQHDMGSMLVYFILIIPFFREGMSGLVLFFALLIGVVFVLSLVLKPLTVLLILVAAAFLAFAIIRRKGRELLIALIFWLVISMVLFFFAWLFLGQIPDLYHVLALSSILTAISLFAITQIKRIPQAPLVTSVFLMAVFFNFSVDFVFNKVLAPHQKARINIFLGKDNDPRGWGYHINQSKIAIGSGGLSGKGFLHGTQTKYNFVPEQSTDFIFCTVGEEWGFIGSIFILAIFITLMIRIILLAEKQRSVFSRVYGYSVASIIFFHFAINIGMTIGLAPVIGIPLPFFSYGGSSLWFFTILLFVFLRLDSNRLDILR